MPETRVAFAAAVPSDPCPPASRDAQPASALSLKAAEKKSAKADIRVAWDHQEPEVKPAPASIIGFRSPFGTSAIGKTTMATRTLVSKSCKSVASRATAALEREEAKEVNSACRNPLSLSHIGLVVVFGFIDLALAAQSRSPWTPLAAASVAVYVVVILSFSAGVVVSSLHTSFRLSPLLLSGLHMAIIIVNAVWLHLEVNSFTDPWMWASMQAQALQVLAMAVYPASAAAWGVPSLLLALVLIFTDLLTRNHAEPPAWPHAVALVTTLLASSAALGQPSTEQDLTPRQKLAALCREMCFGKVQQPEEEEALRQAFAQVLEKSTTSKGESELQMQPLAERIEHALAELAEAKALKLWLKRFLVGLVEAIVEELQDGKQSPATVMSALHLSQVPVLVRDFVKVTLLGEPAKELSAMPRVATIRAMTNKALESADAWTYKRMCKEMTDVLLHAPQAREPESSTALEGRVLAVHLEVLEKNLGVWDFNVLEDPPAKSQTLSSMGLLALRPVVEDFGVEEELLSTFLQDLEKRYRPLPYHNALHAADVLNSMCYFLRLDTPCIAGLQPLEKLVALVAAVAHDVGHDGKTNRFHMTTETPLARLYNDQSCLEMMHCAITFTMLSVPMMAFLEDMSGGDWAFFRSTFVHCVLGTDISKHLQALKSFKENFDTATAQEEDLDEAKKKQLLSCLLKASDLGGSGKPFMIHAGWSTRIISEFFSQGDAERDLGIPCSPLCDRSATNISEGQVGFLDFIVIPLFTTLNAPLANRKIALHIQAEIQRNREFWAGFKQETFDFDDPEGNVGVLIDQYRLAHLPANGLRSSRSIY